MSQGLRCIPPRPLFWQKRSGTYRGEEARGHGETTGTPLLNVRAVSRTVVEVVTRAAGSYALRTGRGANVQFEVAPSPSVVADEGPWEVRFPKGCGAPGRAIFSESVPRTKQLEPGIRHFSGTVDYYRSFDLPTRLVEPDYMLSRARCQKGSVSAYLTRMVRALVNGSTGWSR